MQVKIGVIGCGAIAQVHHLPWLTELAEEFEVVAVCDISAQASQYVAGMFKIPRFYTDYRELIASEVDAVLLCQTDPKTEIAAHAIRKGKHVFIEKPVCLNVGDVDLLIEERSKTDVVVQAGYVKLFEPAFEYALSESETMEDISLAEIRHIHPNNALHVKQFRTKRFDDVPEEVVQATRASLERDIRLAIGDVSPRMRSGYITLAGSLIHDFYGLRKIMGPPKSVISAEFWDGRGGLSGDEDNRTKAVNVVLSYNDGARATVTWIDLPDLWDFDETLKIYGDAKRINVAYATGFSKNQSSASVQELTKEGHSQKREPILDWESPFRRELRHFSKVINGEEENRAPLEEVRLDVALNTHIVQSYLSKSMVEVI